MGNDLYELFKHDNFVINNGNEMKKFYNTIQSGKKTSTVVNNYAEAVIDTTWVEKIESCIIPLDNVVRNPGRFIKREEEIIPIELARNIDNESIKHLSQHTNYIQSVSNGYVTPKKILNSFKEESIDTYENRFIHTLLINLTYFINKRLEVILNASGVNEYGISYENRVSIGDDNFHVKIEVDSSNRRNAGINDIDKLISANVNKMTTIQRINRIRQIIYDFQASQFFRSMEGTAPVRSPLQMTNKLLKNVDYQACVSLWAFIQTYDHQGVEIKSVNCTNEVSSVAKEDFDIISSELYVLLKKHTGNIESLEYNSTIEKEKKNQYASNEIKRIINDLDLSTDDIKKTFLDIVEISSKKTKRTKNTVNEIISRAIKNEKDRTTEYFNRIKEAEKKRLLKEENKQKRIFASYQNDSVEKVKSYAKNRNYSDEAKVKYEKFLEMAINNILKAKKKEKVDITVEAFYKKVNKLKVN